MKSPRLELLLRLAAGLTLLGLALMLWSIFVPTVLPVILAMSVGQGVGILAFAMFGYVVLADLRAQRARARAALRGGEASPTAHDRGDDRTKADPGKPLSAGLAAPGAPEGAAPPTAAAREPADEPAAKKETP